MCDINQHCLGFWLASSDAQWLFRNCCEYTFKWICM